MSISAVKILQQNESLESTVALGKVAANAWRQLKIGSQRSNEQPSLDA